MTGTPIIEVQEVHKSFAASFGLINKAAHAVGLGPAQSITHAVRGVSFKVRQGETLAIVGESGSGKSTVGKMICGFLQPSKGRVLYRGEDIGEANQEQRAAMQLAMQMVFQNPFASLNPRMQVQHIIGEAPKVHGLVAPQDLPDFVDHTMEQAGLNPADKSRYPHQFSGGQRQRIGIARALAVSPDVLVCDEAVAALDVSIQAQILRLLDELQQSRGLTYIFISHDLSVVRHISDRVAVMQQGEVVEMGDVDAIFDAPAHEYTRALLADAPRLNPPQLNA